MKKMVWTDEAADEYVNPICTMEIAIKIRIRIEK